MAYFKYVVCVCVFDVCVCVARLCMYMCVAGLCMCIFIYMCVQLDVVECVCNLCEVGSSIMYLYGACACLLNETQGPGRLSI